MQFSMVMMLSRDEVPAFLRTGAFFQNLDSSDEERFVVPTNRFKADPRIKNTADLTLLLRTASFWGLEEPPLTVVSYVVRTHGTLNCEYLQAEFPEYATFLTGLFHLETQQPERVISVAIEEGVGLNVVKHLHEQEGFPINPCAFDAAAALDDLPCIKWLLCKGLQWNAKSVHYTLARGSITCLKHALDNGQPLPATAITPAAAFGRLEMVKYLFSIGEQPSADTLSRALYRGNVEIMRILRQAGCAWPHDALATLIEYNKLDCLIFAHEDGLPLTSRLCAIAAKHGHLSCLEYLHAQGCPWHERAVPLAVWESHLDCMKFIHQHGCPNSQLMTKYAITYGMYDLVPYCMWLGAVDRDVKVCFVSWIFVLVLRVGMWWTGQSDNIIYSMAGFWAIFTTTYVHMTMKPILAWFVRLVIIFVAAHVAWGMVNK